VNPESPTAPECCCRCGYNLAGITIENCPECGGNIATERARRGPPKRVIGLLICLWIGAALWAVGAMAIEGFSRVYTGSPISPDPVSISIHLLAVGVGLGAIAATFGRRHLRFAPRIWFGLIGLASAAQLLLWFLALVMLVH